jgi:hypothetical protein
VPAVESERGRQPARVPGLVSLSLPGPTTTTTC